MRPIVWWLLRSLFGIVFMFAAVGWSGVVWETAFSERMPALAAALFGTSGAILGAYIWSALALPPDGNP